MINEFREILESSQEAASRELLLERSAFLLELSVDWELRAAAEAAALKMIFEISIKLLSLNEKKKKSSAMREIASKLNQINREFARINAKLNEIQVQLDSLEKMIVDAPYQSAILQNNALMIRISGNYEYWIEDAALGKMVEVESVFSQLSNNNRVLMTRGGYSHLMHLVVAFSFELDLALLVGMSPGPLNSSTETMLSFLRDSIDPTNFDSFAFLFEASNNQLEKLLLWERDLIREKYLETTSALISQSDNDIKVCTVDIYDAITGSLSDGNLQRVQEWRNPRHCGYHTLPGIRNAQYEMELFQRRNLLLHDEIKRKQRSFDAHSEIVKFGAELIPRIESLIDKIKQRVSQQLSLSE